MKPDEATSWAQERIAEVQKANPTARVSHRRDPDTGAVEIVVRDPVTFEDRVVERRGGSES